jgi:restriction system protein
MEAGQACMMAWGGRMPKRERHSVIDQFPFHSIATEVWPAFALLLVVMALKLVLSSPRVKGRIGEKWVSRALRSRLDPEKSILLEDVTLPAGTGTTQIDHVVITPAGVFVIETKNMAGWIFGDAQDRRWTQVLHRKKTRFQNPLNQNNKHLRAIEAVTDVDRAALFNIVVFAGDAKPKTPFPDNVFWKPRRMVDWLLLERETRFSPEDMAAMRDRIEATRLQPGRDTDRAHIAHVKTLVGTRR